MKYKHITTGTIAVEHVKTHEWEKDHPKTYDFNTGGLVDNSLPASFIENSKDWEEVVEKPAYIILSFSEKMVGRILTVKEIEKLQKKNPGMFALEAYLSKESLWNIYSVRRESDGETKND